MSHSWFTVKAEGGRPDSLKRSVKIAFNLSPEEVNGPSHPYSPIARYISTFGPGGGSARIPSHPLFQLGLRSPQGKQLTGESNYVFDLTSGQIVTLNSPTSWGSPVPRYSEGVNQPSFTVTNESGSSKDIILSRKGCSWYVAYHPLETGHSITVPTRWRFQAYIVDDSVIENTILQPEDLKHPIFPVPIPLDPLPKESTWILSQDNNGELRINNNEFYLVKEPDPVSKKDPLSEVLERLAVMEKSIARVQEDVATGQRAMNDIRTQLSTLERSVSTAKEEVRTEFQQSIAVVEAKTATLAGSFDQSQDRLSLAHKAVADTQTLLAEVEKSSNSRFQDLSRRLPQVEAKAEAAVASVARSQSRLSTMEESNTRAQDHIVAVEKALQQTRDQVTVVQQLIASNTRLAAMGLSTGVATLEPNPPSKGLPLDHDKRIPAIEARVERLEKSTGEQHKALRALDRRTQAELSAVQLSVAGLGSRVSVPETSADGDGGEAGVGDLSSSASDEGSPVTFPHHLAANPSVAQDSTGFPPV